MDLLQKIESGTAVVGVIGLGYVGLPLLAAFHRAKLPVIGFDTDSNKVRMLLAGESYLKHLGSDLVSNLQKTGSFDATTDFSRLTEADALIICVPTPVGKHLEPDLSYIERATSSIAQSLRGGQLIILESSTYPGTTREVVLPRLEGRGLRCGRDYFVAYSPEREDPGRKDYNTSTIPKLVGGIDPLSGTLAAALYRKAIAKVVPVSSAEVAEAAKILENTYRAINIALVNEMKIVLTKMDINIWEVIAAAATKPFGFEAFYPGPGLGGHCVPVDPFYLTWKAKEVGQPTRFIELAGEINHAMPAYVVERTTLALNERGKPVKGSRILILGLAYKPDIDDVRESPSFELIAQFAKLGAILNYNDPHVPRTHKMRKRDLKMSSVALTMESIASYDCVVIATHHSSYDWQMISDHAQLVIDTRNALGGITGNRDHIVRA